jgi:general secretion pathway protein J
MNPTGMEAGESGFTLMELLVAMALLALMTTALLSTLQTSRHTTRLLERTEQDSSIESIATHLRRSIEAARIVYQNRQEGQAELSFRGSSGLLRLTTVSDGRLEVGGLYTVEYALSASDNGNGLGLVTRRQPYRPTGAEEYSEQRETLILIDGLQSLRFRYFGSPAADLEPLWLDEWPRADSLPRGIEVLMEFPDGDRRTWMPLKVLIPAAH